MLVMPPPALIVATKLARAYDSDIEDANWWIRERGLTRQEIEDAIQLIPQPDNREEALGPCRPCNAKAIT